MLKTSKFPCLLRGTASCCEWRSIRLRIDILGVGFDNLTPEQMADMGMALLSTEGFHYAVTPNPEFILAAKKQPEFLAALNGADLSMPDGIGVV